jgi:hypothetical protein
MLLELTSYLFKINEWIFTQFVKFILLSSKSYVSQKHFGEKLTLISINHCSHTYIQMHAHIQDTHTHTNILQSISPPLPLTATAKLQLVLSDIQESLHDLQLQQF